METFHGISECKTAVYFPMFYTRCQLVADKSMTVTDM